MATVKSRLRVRPGATPAIPLVSARPASPLFSERGFEGPNSPAPNVAKRMYSDVAALRPPSPAGSSEKEVALPPNQSAGAGNRPSDFVRKHVITPVMYNEGNYTPSESSDSDHDQNTREWTTVQRKRRGNKHSTSKERFSTRDKDVSVDVDPVLAEAEKSLTNAQKEKIALRHQKVTVNPLEGLESHEEGPSGPKGKGVDPRNWGNIQLDEDEADVEAQQAAFN